MTLFQISEPGEPPLPHARKRAIGIDLGTTNSLVATVRNGLAVVLPDDEGQPLDPLRHLSPLERDCLLRYCALLRDRLGGSLLRLVLFGSAARGAMWDAGSPMSAMIAAIRTGSSKGRASSGSPRAPA